MTNKPKSNLQKTRYYQRGKFQVGREKNRRQRPLNRAKRISPTPKGERKKSSEKRAEKRDAKPRREIAWKILKKWKRRRKRGGRDGGGGGGGAKGSGFDLSILHYEITSSRLPRELLGADVLDFCIDDKL